MTERPVLQEIVNSTREILERRLPPSPYDFYIGRRTRSERYRQENSPGTYLVFIQKLPVEAIH